MKIQIKIHNKGFWGDKLLPMYMTSGSAAIDLCCIEDVVLYPGETKLLNTGLAVWIKDPDVMGMIVPRSGMGTKGLVLANTVGIIDSDYQGEIKISAWNRNESVGWVDFYMGEDKKYWLGKEPYNKNDNIDSAIKLQAGERIAQLIFVPVIKAHWCLVDEFTNKTKRGSGGFGSTK